MKGILSYLYSLLGPPRKQPATSDLTNSILCLINTEQQRQLWQFVKTVLFCFSGDSSAVMREKQMLNGNMNNLNK